MAKSNLVVLICIAVAIAFYYIRKMPKFDSGEFAPEFKSVTINGDSLSLSDFKGQYVLLDFWGSWCPPCRKENPQLVGLYNEFNGKSFKDASDFQIISIAVETNQRAWANAIKRDNLSWRHHISKLKRFNDPIVSDYGVKEIPTKYLVGPNFEIIGVNWTVPQIEEYLTEKIRS